MKTSVTIFTGFLGSGKTTLISHLIDELQAQGRQVVYIKNELGSENIDAQLLKGKHITTRELLNGCICCTLVGPFIAAINEVIDQLHPDRIVIEASGAADPSAIALMVSSHPRLFRDGVVSIIDVVNFDGYEDLSQTARNQATFTDLIIFNKVELVDLQRKQAVVGYVRELNDTAPILEAPNGQVAAEVLLGVSTPELDELLSQTDVHAHEHHLETDNLSSFSLRFDQPFNRETLESQLDQLAKQVFRVKGIVYDQDHQPWVVNRVGKRTEITLLETSSTSSTSTLVFIGFGLEEIKPEVKAIFSAVN